MKTLILFLITFFTASLYAQNVTFDTTYIVNNDNLFFEYKRTEYANRTHIEKSTLIGDTTNFDFYMRKNFFTQMQPFQGNAAFLLNVKKTISNIISSDNYIVNTYGFSPLIKSQKRYENTFLQDTFVLIQNGVQTPLSFSTTQTGKLTCEINSSVKVVDLFADVLRLNDYPVNGYSTIFYKMSDDSWVDLQNGELKRIGIYVAPPPQEELPIQN